MKCTVCEKQKEGYFCPECGFDESCNYDLFRTFAPLSGRIKSVSGHREANGIVLTKKFSEKSAGFCPVCGFDESLNYVSYGTFAPLSGRIKSFSEQKREQITSSDEYRELLVKSQEIIAASEAEKTQYKEIIKELREYSYVLEKRVEDLEAEREQYKASLDKCEKDLLDQGKTIDVLKAERGQLIASLDKCRTDLIDREKTIEYLKAGIAELSSKSPSHQPEPAGAYSTLTGVSVGNIIKFGAYKQGKNGEREPIEWLVLAKENGRALLISKYALDCQRYNNKSKLLSGVTWETCSLRKWLNEEFYYIAFSSDEQSRIQTTTVTADKNPKYDTDPGKDTQDKVFLLSGAEAEEYFSTDEARRCAPTDYANEQGVWISKNYKTDGGRESCSWWLRTPGYFSGLACYVSNLGFVYHSGDYVDNSYGVRPALWISL